MWKLFFLILSITTLQFSFLDLVFADQPISFFTNSKLSANIRSYYLNKEFSVSHSQESLAYGGSIGYQVNLINNLKMGFVGYTTQGMFFTNPAKGGGGILTPSQTGITTLGQAYLQPTFQDIRFTLYRQMIETPFINGSYNKMIPKLYEAYTFEVLNNETFYMLLSEITKIKGTTSTEFQSMSVAAGYSDTDYPVTALGTIITPQSNWNIQLWDYICTEFMNVAYLEANSNWALNNDFTFYLSGQTFFQQSIGKAIAGNFSTNMVGISTGLGFSGFKLSLAYTYTNNSHNFVNPWGSFPGYTSVMEEDCNLAGEKAWLIGLGYDFSRIGINGLTFFTSFITAQINQPVQTGMNCALDYKFGPNQNDPTISFKVAHVKNALNYNGQNFTEYRLIYNQNIL